MAWDNGLIFKNCDLTGVRALRIKAAAPIDPITVQLYLDDAQEALEAAVPACDGFTDFKSVEIPLHAEGCHLLRLTFPQLACIRSIQVIK